MVRLLERACAVIAPSRLWVNPDCGLKTRGWPETATALKNMIDAAVQMRAKLQGAQTLQKQATHEAANVA